MLPLSSSFAHAASREIGPLQMQHSFHNRNYNVSLTVHDYHWHIAQWITPLQRYLFPHLSEDKTRQLCFMKCTVSYETQLSAAAQLIPEISGNVRDIIPFSKKKCEKLPRSHRTNCICCNVHTDGVCYSIWYSSCSDNIRAITRSPA